MTSSAAVGQPPAFIEVGQGDAARRIAVAPAHGGSPGPVLARRLQVGHAGHQGARARRVGRRARPRLRPVRLFRPWRIRRRISSTAPSDAGWKRASRCSSGSAAGPQVVIGSSMGGWMALLLARELAEAAGHAYVAGRAGADRAGARFHRGTDVEGIFARNPPGDRDQGRVAAAVAIWRALSDHPRR